jgi:DNA-binding transcriptional ArsR family regulator
MVERTLNLDYVFGSLADSTRRDILRRLSEQELSIGEVAKSYDLTFAAVSKHLKVLEKAQLIIKRRNGKKYLAQASPVTIQDAIEYLNFYQKLMEGRLDSLESYLNGED